MGRQEQHRAAGAADAGARGCAARTFGEGTDRIRAFADNAPAVLWVTESDGSCTFLSRSWYDYTGQTQAQGLGFGWLEVVHPDDRVETTRTFEAANERHEAFSIDYRLRRADGVYRWAIGAGRPRFDDEGEFCGFVGSVIDVHERKQAEVARAAHARVLEMVASAQPLRDVLRELARFIESQITGSIGSILLLDESGRHLRYGAAPGLPRAYNEAIDGVEIGPNVGSCGTAVHRGERVIVEDIDTDPLWSDYRHIASAYDLRACWSQPIRAANGELLGTSAIYFRQPRAPAPDELLTLEATSRFAGIALDRHRAHEALRHSEEHLRHALDAAGMGRWRADLATGIVTGDANWSRTLGRGPADTAGSTQQRFDLVHPDDRPAVIAAWERAVEHRGVYETEFRIRREDGRTGWIREIGRYVDGRPGESGLMIGLTQDITERKESEEKLRRNAETFAALVEQSPLGIYTVDADFRIAHVSEGSKPAFQNVQPVVGRDFAEVMHTLWPEPFADEVIRIFRHTLESGEPYVSPGLTERRKDIGAIESYEWQVNRVMLADGRYGVVCYYFDSTRIQEAHQALRESEARFRALADNMSQFAWTADADGRIYWFNQRWFDYTGTTLEEVEGWGWKRLLHPDHAERVVSRLQHSWDTGEVWEDTFLLRGENGAYRWFLSRAVPIHDEQGSVVRWFGTNTDITERQEHEEQLRTVMAELNHRVKNTLAIVHAIANQTARRSPDLETFATSFQARLQSIAKAHSLLTSTEWRGCLLNDIVQSEISSRVPGHDQVHIGGPLVMMSPKHCLAIHMVLHELTTNAIKYGALKDDRGKIDIRWSTQERRGASWIELVWRETCSVELDGSGPMGYGSRLIEQSVTYDLHGVLDRCVSSKGFSYRIEFPVSGPAPGERSVSTRDPGETARSQGRILVVEDNLTIAMTLVDELRELGIEVLGPANTLEDAMRLAEAETPAAALLDVDLDGTKVYPLARLLRERGVRFVLLTGYESKDIPEDLRDSTVLSKPISRQQISQFVSSGRF